MQKNIQRGEIYFVYLDPAFGHEVGGYKIRPVVVISINDLQRKGFVVTVVPGTSEGRRGSNFANEAVIEPSGQNGLANSTIFLGHQVRAVDQGRFVGKPIGRLSSAELTQVLEAVSYSLGILAD